ncbi:MAG: pseudaminic acid synthase [Bacteroidales bacterium]|nr:pseudaminic acid synthase [Bacteroidales bacterium]
MSYALKIGTFDFENVNRVFLVAELSANHGCNLQTAIKTIKAAKQAGADAIKLQTYTPDTITINCKSDDFRIKQGTIWDGKYLYDLYKEAYTPWEWHPILYKVAKEEGLICFSTPFDKSAVDFLERLNTPAYKIASFEITDIQLIEYVASKGKPIIISTGIAKLEDIKLAVNTCRQIGNNQIILLKCTSNYPAPISEANLAMIPDMAKRFGVITGLSDHTMGITVPIAATILGAKVIEKHFILNHSVGGPDASFSLNKEEFTAMVNAIREAEQILGKVDYKLTENMAKSRGFSRSLYVVEDISADEFITEQNIRSIRPGYGLHPKYYKDVIGKKTKVDLKRGERLCFENLKLK